MSQTNTAHNCNHYEENDQVLAKDVIIDKDTGAVYHEECDGYIGQVEDFTEENKNGKDNS